MPVNLFPYPQQVNATNGVKTSWRPALLLLLAFSASPYSFAVQLPKEIFALGYDHYEADKVRYSGPFVRGRKNFSGPYSFEFQYASQDIVGRPVDSPRLADDFEDQRESFLLATSLLQQQRLLHLSVRQSEELDYLSDALFAKVEQDFFNGLQTLRIAYGRTWDTVTEFGNSEEQDINHYTLHLGWDILWSKRQKIRLDYQLNNSKGALGDPYAVAIVNTQELAASYPRNRTARSISVRYQSYTASGSSISHQYRYYRDSWDLSGHSFGSIFIAQANPRWNIQGHYRIYMQNGASFFNTNAGEMQQYLVNDKELSDFQNYELGINLRRKLSLIEDFIFSETYLNFAYTVQFFEFDDFEVNNKSHNSHGNVVQIYVTAKL